MDNNNNFHANEQDAKETELDYLSRLYQVLAGPNGTYEYAHGESNWARSLQQHGVDVDVRCNGSSCWYDNKIIKCPKDKFKIQDAEGHIQTVTSPYTHLCFETLSCSKRGKETKGWGHNCRADKLTYAFEQIIPDLPIFYDALVQQDMQGFKKWVWGLDLTRYQYHTMLDGNRTRCVLLPINEILEAFPDTQRYFVFRDRPPIPVLSNKEVPVLRWIPHIKKKLENKIIPIRKEAS